MRVSRASRSRRNAATSSHFRVRFSFLAAFYLFMSASVAFASVRALRAHHAGSALQTVPFGPRAKYLVLIVLDGARPDYLGLTSLPNVDALRAQGVEFSNAFDGILESETPSGHTTIATGSTPARNGILGFDWAQNDNDYSLFSPDVVRAGAMEHIMESAHVPTIAGLFKARYPKAKVVALSGHKYYAADPLGGPSADAIMYYQGDPKGRYIPVAIPGHVPPAGLLDSPQLIAPTIHLQPGQEDTLATRLAIATFARMHQRVTLINYPEFDWPLGHVDGGSADPGLVATYMKDFDGDLGMIEQAYKKAGILNQTMFVITADHGMEPVNRFIPQTVITNAVKAAGAGAPAISYCTAAYVWLSDSSKGQAVAQNIVNTHDPGVQSVYYMTTQGGRATYVQAPGSTISPDVDSSNRFLLSTLINGHEPTVVTFANEYSTFSDPKTGWKGDHGGASWQSQHIPLIMAGPGIRHGTVTDPAQLEDVAPTVLASLGVQPTGMEGHILTNAFLDPPQSDVVKRRAEVGQIQPFVQAMISQDNREITAQPQATPQ